MQHVLSEFGSDLFLRGLYHIFVTSNFYLGEELLEKRVDIEYSTNAYTYECLSQSKKSQQKGPRWDVRLLRPQLTATPALVSKQP